MSPLNTGTCRLYQDEVDQNTDESSTFFFLLLSLLADLTAFMISSFLFSILHTGWMIAAGLLLVLLHIYVAHLTFSVT